MENSPLPQVTQCTTLAPEILMMIFYRTVIPKFLITDSSLQAGTNSPWHRSLRTKLSISTVCKSWHAVGIEFLYEDIIFRSLTQLPAFLRTLMTARMKYQHLIKEIIVHNLVTPQYGASFTECLQNILNSCPSLQRFGFLSPCALPLTAALPTLSSNITHLAFNDITPTALHLLRCTHNSLHSLSISLCAPTLRIDADEPFLLLNLEDLFLEFTPFYSHSKDSFIPHAEVIPWGEIVDEDLIIPLTHMLQLFLVPRLCRFSLSSRDSPSEISTFLQRSGQQVRVLLLQQSSFWPAEKIQSLLNACPILEHVVFQEDSVTKSINFTHPTIKWLDIWRNQRLDDIDVTISLISMVVTKTMFPKLERIRHIDVSNTLQKAVSLALAPGLVKSEDDSLVFEYPGIQLNCRPDQVVELPPYPFYEDCNSDSDYVDDASSDHGSDSSSEYSSYSTGLEESETEEPVISSNLIELLGTDDGAWVVQCIK